MWTKNGVCGRCKDPMKRVSRKGIARLLPGAELFFCYHCNQPHLIWLGLNFKLKKPKYFR